MCFRQLEELSGEYLIPFEERALFHRTPFTFQWELISPFTLVNASRKKSQVYKAVISNNHLQLGTCYRNCRVIVEKALMGLAELLQQNHVCGKSLYCVSYINTSRGPPWPGALTTEAFIMETQVKHGGMKRTEGIYGEGELHGFCCTSSPSP